MDWANLDLLDGSWQDKNQASEPGLFTFYRMMGQDISKNSRAKISNHSKKHQVHQETERKHPKQSATTFSEFIQQISPQREIFENKHHNHLLANYQKILKQKTALKGVRFTQNPIKNKLITETHEKQLIFRQHDKIKLKRLNKQLNLNKIEVKLKMSNANSFFDYDILKQREKIFVYHTKRENTLEDHLEDQKTWQQRNRRIIQNIATKSAEVNFSLNDNPHAPQNIPLNEKCKKNLKIKIKLQRKITVDSLPKSEIKRQNFSRSETSRQGEKFQGISLIRGQEQRQKMQRQVKSTLLDFLLTRRTFKKVDRADAAARKCHYNPIKLIDN